MNPQHAAARPAAPPTFLTMATQAALAAHPGPASPKTARPLPTPDVATDADNEEDPWRYGWLASSLALRQGLCVREAPACWSA